MKVLDMSYNPLHCRSGKWADLSRFGNHGTSHGGARPYMITPGVMGFKFDGNSGYADCGSDESLNITNAVTVEAWIKANSWTTTGGVSLGVFVWKAMCYGLIFSTSGSVGGIFYRKGGNPLYILPESDVLNTGQWYHVVGVYDGQKAYTYVDGSLVNSKDYPGILVTNSYPVYIGGFTTIRHFNGLIAQPRIYNRALSADEIRENMYRSPIYRMLRGLPHSMIYTKVPWKQTGGIYVL